MSDTPKDLAHVEALLAERDALHNWLTKLDDSGTATPASVRDRVRADYQGRLDGVASKLAAHGDTLAKKLADDRAEHDGLAVRMAAAREALAEVELRHSVGEYDGKRFESERASHVGDLESYEVSITAVAERIARLEDVQEMVRRAPTPIADDTQSAEGDPAPVDAEVDATPVERGEDEAIVSIAELEEETADRTDGDLVPPDALETETLLAMFGAGAVSVGHDEASEPVAAADDADADEPADADADDGDGGNGAKDEPEVAGFGPLSFTRSGEVPAAPPPIGMPGADQAPRFVRPAKDRGSELTETPSRKRGQAIRVEHDPAPIIPETSGESEATPRTLRCGECGAMNRPLEWYCEKCGAELSAV